MLKFLLLLLLTLPTTPLSPRPILLLPDFSTPCDTLKPLTRLHSIKCIPYKTDTQSAHQNPKYTSLKTQSIAACKEIEMLTKNSPSLFTKGIYLLGLGLGGLITRDIFQNCISIKELVKRIVLVGTPHLGVLKNLPNFLEEKGDVVLDKDFRFLMGEKYKCMEEIYVFENVMGQYLNDLNFDPLETVEGNYSGLEVFVNFYHEMGKGVFPRESESFGTRYDEGFKIGEDMKSFFMGSIFYQVDFMGLAELHDSNRFFNCGIDLDYMDLGFGFLENRTLENKNQVFDKIFSFFDDDCQSVSEELQEKIEESEAYKLCLRRNIKKYELLEKAHCDYKYEFQPEDLDIVLNDKENEIYRFEK